MRSNSSHESVQQSPKMAPKWLDPSSRQNQPVEESHTFPPLKNTWPWQSLVHSDGNLQGQNMSSYNGKRSDDKLTRRNIESTSPSGNITMNAFEHGNSINMNGAVYTEKGPEAYQNSQNYHQREDSNDSYRSNASHHTITEDETRENMWLHARGNQNASGQVGQKASTSRRFLYDPKGNLRLSIEHADAQKHVMHLQVLSQEISRGSSSHQRGYFAHNFVGDASDNAIDMEKVVFDVMLIQCLRIAS